MKNAEQTRVNGVSVVDIEVVAISVVRMEIVFHKHRAAIGLIVRMKLYLCLVASLMVDAVQVVHPIARVKDEDSVLAILV